MNVICRYAWLVAASIGLVAATSYAQTYTAPSQTQCTQSGQTMTCVSKTIFDLAPSINLTGATSSSFQLGSGSVDPNAPTSCTLTPTSANITKGQTVNFTAGCASGAVTQYEWKVNGQSVASGNTLTTYTLPASYTGTAGSTVNVQVVFYYGTNNQSLTRNGTVVVQNDVVDPPPQSHQCTGTPPPVTGSLNTTTINKVTSSGLKADGMFITKIVVPDNPTSKSGSLSFNPNGGNSAFRAVSVSKTMCDFTSSANTKLVARSDAGGSAVFNLGTTAPNSNFLLTPGTWYVNVKNGSCSNTCDVYVQWSPQ